MRYLLIFILSFFCTHWELASQTMELQSFELKSKINKLQENERLDLIINSTDPSIRLVMERLNISYKGYFKSFYRIEVNRQKLDQLLKTVDVEYIESGFGIPLPLNDTMRLRNNIEKIHNGNPPLKTTYKGQGVIVGFIDTGIDFTHPDFKDSTGKTRVINLWDQGADTLIGSRIPNWGYGQVWDSSDINSASCPHDDDVLSHGTNVAGIAVGNGSALNEFTGAAPEADIVYVASDFNAANWLQSVADGVEYIFGIADQADKPCVINISAGDYLGSHDGTDLAAIRIDSLLKAERGRAVVAAAGNSGNISYHLGYNVGTDTNFTWFEYNANSFLGYGAVYYQLWSDTADFNQVQFSFGANMTSPTYTFRGQTPFDNISNRLNILYRDSIYNGSNVLAYVETFASLQRDKYLMEVHIKQPDSSQYYYSFISSGNGKFDIWSDAWLGTSHIVKSPLPSSQIYPAIVNYKTPDSLQTVVSSFTCLSSVVTVGNYINRNAYLDYDTVLQTFNVVPGEIADNSSHGPSRRGIQKPDISATGNFTLTANRLASIPLHIANGQSDRIAKGGMHKRNGGTSMAAPVVAGSIALLLEHCPLGNHESIKQWLIGTAATDTFTGTVPNYTYGFGKVDAFQSMSDQLYTPNIVPGGNLVVCEGEEITLNGPDGMTAYQWSSGDNTPQIFVDSSAIIQLTTKDSNACIGNSDTVYVTQVDNPPIPVITKISSVELKSSPGDSYQWYLDGNIMPGATSQILLMTKSGSYEVSISDVNGCSSISNEFEVYLGDGEHKMDDFRIFPNPSSDGRFYFTTGNEQNDFSILIYNSDGSLIGHYKNNEEKFIDISTNSHGVYHYRIIFNDGTSTSGTLVFD